MVALLIRLFWFQIFSFEFEDYNHYFSFLSLSSIGDVELLIASLL